MEAVRAFEGKENEAPEQKPALWNIVDREYDNGLVSGWEVSVSTMGLGW